MSTARLVGVLILKQWADVATIYTDVEEGRIVSGPIYCGRRAYVLARARTYVYGRAPHRSSRSLLGARVSFISLNFVRYG